MDDIAFNDAVEYHSNNATTGDSEVVLFEKGSLDVRRRRQMFPKKRLQQRQRLQRTGLLSTCLKWLPKATCRVVALL